MDLEEFCRVQQMISFKIVFRCHMFRTQSLDILTNNL